MNTKEQFFFNDKDPKCIDYYISNLTNTIELLDSISRRDEDFRTAVMDASFKDVLTVSYCLKSIDKKLKRIKDLHSIRPTKAEADSAANEHPYLKDARQ